MKSEVQSDPRDFLAELAVLRRGVIGSGVPLLNEKDIDERLADMRDRSLG